MREVKIDVIAGARPNFVKVAAIISASRSFRSGRVSFKYRLVHTGQHYDNSMSGSFFEQLGLPMPDIRLEVGSGTHAEQTGQVMKRYEDCLIRERADVCIVVGDVNSTMACAITARKMGVRVAHVEAGIRSGDWSMPEEINRVVTDSVSNWMFTTSVVADCNLLNAGVPSSSIFRVGNTMIDTLMANLHRLRPSEAVLGLGLQRGRYLTLTLHRPSNVDDPRSLAELLYNISQESSGIPVVFPTHPRTARIIQQLGIPTHGLRLIDPLGYLEFMDLVRGSMAVITDSGGVTEEATVLRIPCLTLRDNTERPETVEIGTNELIGSDPEKLKQALIRVKDGRWKRGSIPELWDGKASQRIFAALEGIFDR